jgi:hypothetical protein
MSYQRSYQRYKRRGDEPGKPTQRQLDYLNSLIEKSGITQQQWQESVGLIEANAWGGRVRNEMITRRNVSRWIDRLISCQPPKRRGRCEDAPCCGCCP